MFRRPVCTVFAIVASLSTVFATGCSEDTQATPRVTLNADMTAGNNNNCLDGSNGWLTIGSFGNPNAGTAEDGSLLQPVRPVDDGAAEAQGVVAVNCRVAPLNDGFDVAASAQLSGATGGVFTVEGFFKPGVDNSNLSVTLTRNGQQYKQSDCTSTFSGIQAVAAGRVWADITCNKIANDAQDRACNAAVQVRFENCTQ